MNSTSTVTEGAHCTVVGGTHAGKSGTVTDINTSKTGHVTITVVQKNGVRSRLSLGMSLSNQAAAPNYSIKGNSHRTDVCPLISGVRGHMKHLRIADLVLRALAAFAVCSAASLLLFLSIFIADSGTAAAERNFFAAVGGIIICTALMLAWLAWPHKLEQFIPGPTWVGISLVRGPLYGVGILGVAGILWLQLQTILY